MPDTLEPAIQGAEKRSNVDMQVDELLVLWHRHRRGYQFTRGYGSSDATCRDYRSPGHWDWQNGASDARADELVVRGVDQAMNRIPDDPRRWNTALQVQARNLATGYDVWRSPVLPQNPAERAVLVLEARNRLTVELMRAGVLG